MNGTCVAVDPDRFGARARNFSILAAAMVVLIHAGWAEMPGVANRGLYQLLAWGLCTFAVPGFFLISGFFLAARFDEPGWWQTALRRRAGTLLAPYLIWNALAAFCSVGCGAVLAIWSGRSPCADISFLREFVLGLGLDPFAFPKLIPLWYVRALMLLVLFSPLLKFAVTRLGWWTVPPGFFLQLLLCGVCDRYDPVPFLFYGGPLSLAGLLYFLVGILLRRVGLPRVCAAWGWRTLLPIAFLVVVGGRVLFLLGFRAAGDCCWVVGIPFLLGAVWRQLPERSGPRALVTAAFPVFLLHMFNVMWVSRCLPLDASAWWIYPVRSAVVFAASVGEAALIRCCPPLARLLFGGR